jgi:NAD(P)-dependent dehydrogenase (short-subunit alcohol dehydrogenase family)
MVAETKSLAGKVAIVTGGGTGLGKCTALMLAQEGADVVVAARRTELIEQTAQEIKDLGRRALAITADVTDSRQVNQMVERALSEMGRLDILMNNAGIVRGMGPRTKPIWDVSDAEWMADINVNLSSAFYCSRAVARHFADQKSGKIVNWSSEVGANRGARDWFGYPAAKGGVVMLTKSLALSLAQYNVQVNCIVPGLMDTSGFQAPRPPPPPGAPAHPQMAARADFAPIARHGNANDIGYMALFLAADASDYITGGIFNVNGGRLADGFGVPGYAPVFEMEEV